MAESEGSVNFRQRRGAETQRPNQTVEEGERTREAGGHSGSPRRSAAEPLVNRENRIQARGRATEHVRVVADSAETNSLSPASRAQFDHCEISKATLRFGLLYHCNPASRAVFVILKLESRKILS